MEATATINVRIPEKLKNEGALVLERNGISPAEIVRSVYRYMEQKQEIPPCLDVAKNTPDFYETRRQSFRRIQSTIAIPDGYDAREGRARRIEEKYGDLL